MKKITSFLSVVACVAGLALTSCAVTKSGGCCGKEGKCCKSSSGANCTGGSCKAKAE